MPKGSYRPGLSDTGPEGTAAGPVGIAGGPAGVDPGARHFYLRTMKALNDARLPYLVGGGYALSHYTGIARPTKDFDIFASRDDYDRIMEVLAQAGYHTELTFPHWLGKATCEHGYVDVIFNSGNGISRVDDDWFRYSAPGDVFGVPVRICPVEEMIWSKAFIMERERYDGADIMHLLLACAGTMDWTRLIRRFGAHWRVLFAHLCQFGFIYPSERARIPEWIVAGLLKRMDRELRDPSPEQKLCRGTLLSREQYLIDIQQWGFTDVRVTSASTMTPGDIVLWTDAIDESK